MSELLQLGSPNQRPRPPRIEELDLRFSEAAIAELEALRRHYPEEKACILPCLWIAQREYGGHLTGDAIAEVAFRLHRSYAEIEGVATFYSLYNTVHEPGRHKLELCTCLTCHVNGTWELRDYVRRKLGIGHGETTDDGVFTFEEVECLNACDRAPVVQVGDEYFGPMTEASLDELIERLRKTPESTVVQYARSVVNVHLRKEERPTSPAEA
ncbi:complex I 24 kDa subunit family protein [Fimbriimonas ginsengisoli]|uniref:Putative NADH-ubiquinone oxidoreductase subunit n=1 Tax=Fimbriimonas ginsengisoli Gsoil 348 TaxID=661478 RepID=A0A068NVH4_FIMGI|nr:NAD(P)H-dependent oxidoreductase subunit E [Fimbriimonas ginsengisoli]AIE86790.1 putative NADH-ubiquinone oxidoreductase subunit [Fimbriimonas ginsengisoli Gsoil 348]